MRLSFQKIAFSASRRCALASLAVPSLAALLPRTAFAADGFPSRPLRLVVPFPAGGSSDSLARVAGLALMDQLHQTVVIDNRGGAGGNIAADAVARAPADGYTILLAGQGILAINKPLYKTLPYDPAALEYIGMLGAYANVLLVNSKLGIRTVAEFVARAKQQSGKLSYGSNGVGSLSHLTTELFATAAGVRFLHVPYRGAAPLSNDLMGGSLDFCFTGSTLAAQLAKQGLVPLAVTTSKRIGQLPQVPTLAEAGYPEATAPSWWALMAPAHTPAAALARLRSATTAVVTSPTYVASLEKQATLPFVVQPEAAAAFFEAERVKWAEAVKKSGATAE
jgi:tripartite-type tricarboxylate transporter receptor subunit TctC